MAALSLFGPRKDSSCSEEALFGQLLSQLYSDACARLSFGVCGVHF